MAVTAMSAKGAGCASSTRPWPCSTACNTQLKQKLVDATACAKGGEVGDVVAMKDGAARASSGL